MGGLYHNVEKKTVLTTSKKRPFLQPRKKGRSYNVEKRPFLQRIKKGRPYNIEKKASLTT